MFVIFKLMIITAVSKMFHFHLWEKSTVVNQGFSLKKFLESMIGAFQIVFPFYKNSYRPASDMTCFTDIYLRVKRTEHK